jgi:muconolactone D-isomerase
MLFYMQMRWNIEGRLSFENVWDLEIEESEAAKADFKILGMYKVAGQRRVIAIVDMPSADDLDRTIMGRLPYESFWSLRPSGRSRIFWRIAAHISERRR